MNSSALQPGAEIGSRSRYRVLHSLYNADGSIYLGLKVDTKELVRIETFPIELDPQGDLQREMREMAAQLSRLRLATLPAFRELTRDDQNIYLILDQPPGRTLAETLGERPQVDREEALSLIRRAARGLVELHEVGAMHGGLRPDTIVVTPDQSVRFIDFGGLSLEALARTGKDSVLLAYSAPELIEWRSGVGQRPGPTCDIYSMGGVLYRLLCGRPPFEPPDVVVKILERKPKSPAELVDGLDQSDERLVLNCLAKRPEERPASAAELVGRLDTLLPQADHAPPRAATQAHAERLVEQAELRTEDGRKLSLKGRPHYSLGRYDPEVNPDPGVDVTGLPEASTVSRLHAWVIHRDDGWFFTADPNALNPTYINEERINPGEYRALSDGDLLLLGRLGLVFRLTQAPDTPHHDG